MAIPLPPKKDISGGVRRNDDAKLDPDEYGFILSSCLKPKHRDDPKVIEFIDAFVRCKNIAQASADVGIHKSLGYKWRHRKDIAHCIQKLTDRSLVKYGFDASEIVERVKEIVDFDPIELQRADGTFKKNLFEVSPEARRCLKKLKVKNLWETRKDINGIEEKIMVGEIIDYEFASPVEKLKASELIGTEKEIFKKTTKVEHGVTKDMASILLESAKRADEKRIEFRDAIEV